MRLGSSRVTIASAIRARLTLLADHWLRALMDAVDHVRVHVLVVPGGVVAHGVEDHARMAPRHADVEVRMLGVAVLLLSGGHLPVVLGEMRLGEGHQHPHVVGGPQNLLEAEVRARLAAVVVRVDEVDADPLQPQQALLGPLVAGRRSAHLGIVQRQGREEDSGAVEVEVPAVDPQLAETETHRQGGVQHVVSVVGQRDGRLVGMLRRVEVPELLGLPALGQSECGHHGGRLPRRPGWRTPEPCAVVRDDRTQRVSPIGRQVLQRRAERDPALADGCVHLDLADPGTGRGADEVHITAQPAPLDLAADLPGRVRVAETEHDFLKRPGDDQQTENVLRSPAGRTL